MNLQKTFTQLTLLSPLPVAGIEANGSLSSNPFGSGTYFNNPNGSSTGTGIFNFDFGEGNSFGRTFIDRCPVGLGLKV
ncbi:MAG: hypothetical protein IAF94_20245 [Pirellulaceae bacterium]|nr:hypothetical protein [Pirellulaceae bacterium]